MSKNLKKAIVKLFVVSSQRKKVMSKKEWNGIPGIEEEKMEYRGIESQVKFLQGRVLTIVDTAISPDTQVKQNKAIKDLINAEFKYSLQWLFDLTHKGVRSLTDRELNDIDEETYPSKPEHKVI